MITNYAFILASTDCSEWYQQGISDFIKKQLPSDTTAVDISQPTGKDWALLDVERHAFIHKSQVDEMIRCTPAHVVPHYKTPEGQKFIVLRLTQCSWEKEWQST